MTTNQVLLGVGLILALAVGSQVLASRLRIPVLITRPLVAWLATVRTDLTTRERRFTGPPDPQAGDTMVLLSPGGGDS